MERTRHHKFVDNCMAAFAGFLVESLKRRYSACHHKLCDHADEIVFADGNTYEWPTGCYNVPSAEKMLDTIALLEDEKWDTVLRDKCAVDQILKSLLNDDEPHPVRENGYKYSELISILTECHAAPVDAIPAPQRIKTSEEAIRYASAFGLEQEVMEAMESGMTPMEAVQEWCK